MSRILSLKVESIVIRPSGLKKLYKLYRFSPADTSLGWKALYAKAMAAK